MAFALLNGRVLIDDVWTEGCAVLLQNERIVGIVDAVQTPDDYVPYDLGGGLLAPGFIDTQVNGGADVLFNDTPSAEAIAQIGAAHRRFGTTGFLPTLISTDLDTVATAIEAASQAIAAGTPGVLGLHIEGPFLNAERKGIHDADKFRTIDAAALTLLKSLPIGRTLVTLAPEATNPAMVQSLAEAGVIVSAGHTNATYAQIRDALDHGMTGFTHLFNAMSPLTSRAPGVVGAALDDIHSWCGIIVDGRHVDPVVLKLALRCRPLNRFILATDAMPCVGSDRNDFTLQGKNIIVREGACYDENGTLAGSNLDMAAAVRNAVSMLGVSPAEACRMASLYPAEFLGLGHELGRISPGYRADLVLLDDALEVRQTWIGGRADEALAGSGRFAAEHSR
jgi:N-acetylglucosamine-6-phosphate deacetylase